MMRERSTVIALVVGALVASTALTVPALAAPDQAANSPGQTETVGGFAMKLTSVFEISARSEQEAVAALKAYGVNVGDNLRAPLTEDKASRILTDMGYRVDSPANPGQAVSVGVAGQLATAVAMAPPTSTIESHVTLPFQCLSSPTRAECEACCLANANCANPTGTACRLLCRIFCLFNKPPPPSPTSP